KAALWAPVRFRDFDTHDAKIKQRREQNWIVLRFLVHTRHQRGNRRLSIVAYGSAKECFFIAQDSQRPDRLGAWLVHNASSLQSGCLWLQWGDCTHFCA